MEKSKKIKITIGLFYLIVISSFLYFFLTRFTLQELTSYEFIKNNRDFFFNLKQANLILLSLIFTLTSIFWIFMAGFGSPVILLGGFIFGKWIGVVVITLSLTFGSTLLYIFGNYFLKDFIKDKFLNRFKKLEIKFKKSEFFYLLLYRLLGGIPLALSNVLPCMFNVKPKNFFWATLIGIIPQTFILASIGSGLEKIIAQNIEAPKIIDLIYSPDIYIPILAFVGFVILTFIARKIFDKN